MSLASLSGWRSYLSESAQSPNICGAFVSLRNPEPSGRMAYRSASYNDATAACLVEKAISLPSGRHASESIPSAFFKSRCPESSVIGAVRIDETHFSSIMNVRNRALLRARRRNATQQREHDNQTLHYSLHLLRFHVMVTFLSPPLLVGTVTLSVPLMTSGLFGSIVPLP